MTFFLFNVQIRLSSSSTLLIVCFIHFFCLNAEIDFQLESERPAITMTSEDFKLLVKKREQGLAGFHLNAEVTSLVPAPENIALNWTNFSLREKKRLTLEQEKMFRQGKITMLVLAGGEATRFGSPKPFILVSDDLGEFLEIKVANLNWLNKTYGSNVPLYIMTSEKRIDEFKTALSQRQYYGLNPNTFRLFTQRTVDTFIPSDQELKAIFTDDELVKHLAFAANLRQINPDGIYRFNGERRKVPPGHFDAIAAFIISGLFSEALRNGIEYLTVVNIDNLQAILKNDGMIAYFAEKGDDIGFLLTEKNLFYTISDKLKNELIVNKLIVRFRDSVLSFDGFQEFNNEAEQGNYKFVIDRERKTVNVYDIFTGDLIETKISIKSEVGGTLVQQTNAKGKMVGAPIMKEGFELPSNFDHAQAPFFNTNTIILKLSSFLRFLNVTKKNLLKMDFDKRSLLVREKLMSQIKPNFELKNHEVEGEYSHLGIVKNGKTKIPVMQVTRIMLQVAHLKGAKVAYIFAPRMLVWAPVREVEDRVIAAKNSRQSLRKFILFNTPRINSRSNVLK